METTNSIFAASPGSKALAFAAALFTTLFLMASTAVVFTGSAVLGA